MQNLDLNQIRPIVEQALKEDVGAGDITTLRTISSSVQAQADFVVQEPGVIAGLFIAKLVYELVDNTIECIVYGQDGDLVNADRVCLQVKGSAQSILIGERVVLNYLSYLSGIASYTKQFVDRVKPHGVTILDTRKTIPGLRYIEKYAVRCGGAQSHRFGLFDKILIKDNHLHLLKQDGSDYIQRAVQLAKGSDNRRVEIEVQTYKEAQEAFNAGADILLLDNINHEQLKHIVDEFRGKVILEASGGVSLDTVEKIAQTGIDYISVGSITHSAPSLNISCDMI